MGATALKPPVLLEVSLNHSAARVTAGAGVVPPGAMSSGGTAGIIVTAAEQAKRAPAHHNGCGQGKHAVSKHVVSGRHASVGGTTRSSPRVGNVALWTALHECVVKVC